MVMSPLLLKQDAEACELTLKLSDVIHAKSFL
jgi:hypothetical protein